MDPTRLEVKTVYFRYFPTALIIHYVNFIDSNLGVNNETKNRTRFFSTNLPGMTNKDCVCI